MKRHLKIYLILISLGILSSCGGVQGKPVPLPVPFAGALDGGVGAMITVSKGNALAPSISLSSAKNSKGLIQVPSGPCFEMVNSVGVAAGTICFDGASMSPSTVEGNQTKFTMSGVLSYNTGLVVEFKDAQFFDNPVPETTGQRKGYMGGRISRAEQDGVSVESLINQVVDHRYVYQVSQASDGRFNFLSTIQAAWIVGGFDGVE